MKKLFCLFTYTVILTCVCLPSQAQNTFPSSGNAGIGTTSPNASLDIQDGQHVLRFNRSELRGTLYSSGGAGSGIGRIDFIPDYDELYEFSVIAVDRFGDSQPDLFFQLLPNRGTNGTQRWAMFEGWKGAGLYVGTGGFANPIVFATDRIERMRLDGNGNLGIGTNNPLEKLTVDGKILAEEVVVKLSQNWPDYVFFDDYDRMPIAELEQYIEIHGHLPGIKSAEEVEKEGLAVGEMQAKLLQKIEELTLYIIDQEKRLDALEKANTQLYNQLSTIDD